MPAELAVFVGRVLAAALFADLELIWMMTPLFCALITRLAARPRGNSL
jgi:hypothetical protein